MTIATETSRSGPYAGAGSAGPFTVGFRFLDQSHLQVVKTSTAGVDSTLTLSTNYTVSGAGNPTGSVTLTSALLTGEKLTIIRKVPFTQEADYLANDTFPAESHETALDKLTQQAQQLNEKLARALALPVSSTASATVPLPVAGRLLGWNPAANALDNIDAAAFASLVQFGSSGSQVFSTNGVTTAFTLAKDPGGVNNTQVYINGIYQEKRTYAVAGAALTFSEAPPVGSVEVVSIGVLPLGSTDATLITYTDPVAPSFLKNVSDIISGNEVSLLRFIDKTKHAGIRAGTNTDDLSAAMVTASGAAKSILVPYGTYHSSGGVTLPAGGVWRGEGRNGTIIKALAAANTLFTAAGIGSGLRSLGFNAVVTQTGGSYVALSGTESFIDDFAMAGDFNGVLMTGSVSRIRHGRFQLGAVGAIRIRVEGGDTSQVISDVLMGAETPANVVAAGIRVRNSSALMIQNVSVIQQGVGLLIDPTSNAENVFSLYADNCFFDNGTYGIRIIPTGTGGVYRCRFSNVWASSSSVDGIAMNSPAANSIVGMHFESAHCVLNAGSGLTTGTGCADIAIRGGEFCQNNNGMFFNNTLLKLKITEATIGVGAGLNGNTNAGIVLSAGVDQYVISNNLIVGNLASPIVDNSGAGFRHISNNVGALTTASGTATIAATTTTVVVTHGLAFTPLQHEITLTRGSGNSGSTDLFVNTITATQFTINTAAAPTAPMTVNWTARTKGA